jgi:hypothetical protein
MSGELPSPKSLEDLFEGLAQQKIDIVNYEKDVLSRVKVTASPQIKAKIRECLGKGLSAEDAAQKIRRCDPE